MTRLALLWHMHQPYYEDRATGEHLLPWVRLHAIKDYWGMVALLDEFPSVRMTFNLVPSLLVQVQAFAANHARDRHLEIGLKEAANLDREERRFLIAHGFHAPYHRMIEPYARYAALHARRGEPDTFAVDDLRDLQVWHKLVWMDPDRLARDSRLVDLVGKGEAFAERDKQTLRDIELELLGAVIPAYRAAAERGQVELSTSPFYHPILPLLCDTDSHLRAHPHSLMPRGLFRRPGDARLQLQRAVELHRSLFGTMPAGIWPSEGSVSDEAVALMADLGCQWIATDEAILARSLPFAPDAEALYRPYEVGRRGRTVRCLFRDHGLSDLIGFSYQSWDAEAAAHDFVARVRDAGRRFAEATGGEDAIVPVILDGENAWEHYAGGGRPFLRALYRTLAGADDIATITMAEAAAAPSRRLERVFPGSWIHGDFYIWAGHPDDHRAWSQLAAARRTLEQAGADVAAAHRQEALEELLIAEGSDWFWWYGDDHSSEHDREFDELFRRHVRNVYRALGLQPPDELHLSNITTASAGGPVRIETLITPIIDGRLTDFAEWAGAPRVALTGGAGAMHRVTSALVSGLWVGLGETDLFLRIDGGRLARRLADGRLSLSLVVGSRGPNRETARLELTAGRHLVARSVTEVALPRQELGLTSGGRVSLALLITDARGQVIEQVPAHGPIDLEIPGGPLGMETWLV